MKIIIDFIGVALFLVGLGGLAGIAETGAGIFQGILGIIAIAAGTLLLYGKTCVEIEVNKHTRSEEAAIRETLKKY